MKELMVFKGSELLSICNKITMTQKLRLHVHN
jgi:hypothetical protein